MRLKERRGKEGGKEVEGEINGGKREERERGRKDKEGEEEMGERERKTRERKQKRKFIEGRRKMRFTWINL